MQYLPGNIRKQIEFILDELMHGDLPEELRNAVYRWFAGDESRVEKDEQLTSLFERYWDRHYTGKPVAEAYASLEAFKRKNGIRHRSPKPVKTIPLYLRFRIAAAAALMIALSGSVYLLTEHAGSTSEQDPIAMITISSPALNDRPDTTDHDTVSAVETGDDIHTLPDHSRVRLGEGGTISYAENFAQERRIELRGGAHFNVTQARNGNDYFTIHTDHLAIKVLGTDFDVHAPADGSHSEIDLYHGSVEVTAGGQTIMMKPTDHLHFDHATKAITLATIPYGDLRYDAMPGLVFEKAEIADVLAKLERDYGIRFAIEGEIAQDRTIVNGDLTSFRTLEQVMSVIRRISGKFNYEITTHAIRIKIEPIE